MRFTILLVSTILVGCGGGEDNEDCESVTLTVNVVDLDGATVEGIIVEYIVADVGERVACDESGGGTYTCALPADGDLTVYAVGAPDYGNDNSRISPSCSDANPTWDAVVSNDIGGVD